MVMYVILEGQLPNSFCARLKVFLLFELLGLFSFLC